MRYYLPALLAAVGLASCSHYEAPDLQPVKDKTFTGDNLTLYYNGTLMPNKSITITQNGDKATAKLFADFDLSQLSAFGLSGTIPAPGVLPGSPVAVIDLDMKPADEYWSFMGTGNDTYCSFDYKGYANDNRMALFLSDVKLKTPAISPAVWKPAPLKQEDGDYTSLPFYINWEYEPLPDVDMDLTPYLDALATLPIIPVYDHTAYMSVSQAFALLVQSVAFTEDGSVIVTYVSSIGGASHIAQTLPNRFMYLLMPEQKVNLYLNPTALMGMLLMAGSTGVPENDVKIIGNGLYPSGNVSEVAPGVMEEILKNDLAKKIAASTLKVILPRLADGLPFRTSMKNDQLHFCLDDAVAMQMLEEVIVPLLKDSESLKAIEDYLKSRPNIKPLLPMVGKALQLLPTAFERTNKLEIGFSFVPY